MDCVFCAFSQCSLPNPRTQTDSPVLSSKPLQFHMHLQGGSPVTVNFCIMVSGLAHGLYLFIFLAYVSFSASCVKELDSFSTLEHCRGQPWSRTDPLSLGGSISGLGVLLRRFACCSFYQRHAVLVRNHSLKTSCVEILKYEKLTIFTVYVT